jgi:hypothetical protein
LAFQRLLFLVEAFQAGGQRRACDGVFGHETRRP